MLLLAGCTATASPDPVPSEPTPPFADCAVLTAPGTAAPGTAAPGTAAPGTAAPGTAGVGAAGVGASAAADLPDLTLPCFTGGQPVRLAGLRGPAVLNLWGTWCGPCRDELPAVQRLADRTAGRLLVVGVNTRDDRPAAASFGVDKGIRMPTLYDRDTRLMVALGKVNLPVTVFVDAAGKRFVYNGAGLDDATLAELVGRHTGVTVQP
jgi:thiol-disulfide isomerase/thioredoxin